MNPVIRPLKGHQPRFPILNLCLISRTVLKSASSGNIYYTRSSISLSSRRLQHAEASSPGLLFDWQLPNKDSLKRRRCALKPLSSPMMHQRAEGCVWCVCLYLVPPAHTARAVEIWHYIYDLSPFLIRVDMMIKSH